MNERSGPDFDELVGSDVGPDERERLHRVHELLIEAGPPPELDEAPAPVELAARRRRRPALLALAAALGVAVFALGVLVGSSGDGSSPTRTIAMEGVGEAAGASASLAVYDADGAGNWPMELSVAGLDEPGATYELWLTKSGQPYGLCGSFRVDDDGLAVVPMNAPYELDETAGWIVVKQGSSEALLST
jgi:hypothetical protein